MTAPHFLGLLAVGFFQMICIFMGPEVWHRRLTTPDYTRPPLGLRIGFLLCLLGFGVWSIGQPPVIFRSLFDSADQIALLIAVVWCFIASFIAREFSIRLQLPTAGLVGRTLLLFSWIFHVLYLTSVVQL